MNATELAAYRTERDRFFAEDFASPLPEEQRVSFSGLTYYPYEPTLVLQARFIAAEGTIPITHTTGADRHYHLVGTVDVAILGHPCSLTVLDSGDGEAFIPIRDATAGTETYEGGRYVPVEIDGGVATIDFNLAQNPWCVYDDEFACPLPPPGNIIPVAIRAGEKLTG